MVPVVLFVVLVALVTVEAVLLLGRDGVPSAPDATVAVGRDVATAVTTFDYRRVDDDIARVLAFGTTGFASDFRAAMGADFVERIVTNQRISTGEVVAGPTVQRAGSGRATLLVVVDQRVTSEAAGRAPQVVRVGLLLTIETGDDPKVTGVQVL